MNLRDIQINMELPEVIENIDYIFDHPGMLLNHVQTMAPGFGDALHRMLDIIRALIDNVEVEFPLNDADMTMIANGLTVLPYILFKEEDIKIGNCCAAIVLLAQNYMTVYPHEKCGEVVETLYQLLMLKRQLPLLICAADTILQRYENVLNTRTDFYGISTDFTTRLLNRFNPKKSEEEDINDRKEQPQLCS